MNGYGNIFSVRSRRGRVPFLGFQVGSTVFDIGWGTDGSNSLNTVRAASTNIVVSI